MIPEAAGRFTFAALRRNPAGVSIVETPSPNFNERQLPVSMIVLHYTGMQSAEAALARLTDPAAEV